MRAESLLGRGFSPITWNCGRYRLNIRRPLVMAIVNVSPDSFSGDGILVKGMDIEGHLSALVESGADIIDIGGESTRPGSSPVSEQEELDRVLPFVEVAVTLGVPVSVDTSKSTVMNASIALGADIINDVFALRGDGSVGAVCESSAGVVLMHMKGSPDKMQQFPSYDDVVSEVVSFIEDRVCACVDAGISRSRLCIDPGIGFGKSLEHNLSLFSRLSDFVKMNLPLLVGPSRKSYLFHLLGRSVEDRLPGTLAACLASCSYGAHILRVHDVAAVRDALIFWKRVVATEWGEF